MPLKVIESHTCNFAEFWDMGGKECFIRDSFFKNGIPYLKVGPSDNSMSLTKEMARDVAELLLKFAETGEISP